MTEPTVLRGRAAELRRVARTIETASAVGLPHRAGDDTWRGARPHHNVTTMTGHVIALLDTAGALRAAARRFELRADQLDVMGLGPSGPR